MNTGPMDSGVVWIDALFQLCVDFLMWAAKLLGMSYNEINIWIFCVIWPLFTLLLIAVVIGQRMKIRKLRKQLGGQ